ncbi:hypothetical protein QNI16_29405 [Cytophagaceae bacterium YF14B1]|uniref:Uncharacterized protein n=2 Tax=Xanthocytophaga flava TaxID=3048013 RepID=A0AAE3UAF5_9BACT|nr:hypothetical protein [Xanthocytophaga flavus]
MPISDKEKRKFPVISLIVPQTGKELIAYQRNLDTTYRLECKISTIKDCSVFIVPIEGVAVTKVKEGNNIFEFRFTEPKASFQVFADCGFDKLVNNGRYLDSVTNTVQNHYSYLQGVQLIGEIEMKATNKL